MLTFVGAMKQYFGMKPGQTLSEFGAELRAVSDADKLWYHSELNRIGIACTPPGSITQG